MIEGIQTKFLELAKKGLSVRKFEETKHKLKFEKKSISMVCFS